MKNSFQTELTDTVTPMELMQEYPFSVHSKEDSLGDWHKELSQATKEVARCLDSHVPHPPMNSLRTLLALIDARFNNSGRNAKKLYYQTAPNNVKSLDFHSEESYRKEYTIPI
jgi:hypothetical protein